MEKKHLRVAVLVTLLASFGLFGGCATAAGGGETDETFCEECPPCDCLSPGYSSCEEEYGDQACWLGAGGAGGFGGGG